MVFSRYSNTLDGGTQNTALTASNSSASGSPFTQIFGTGPMIYDSAAAITGTMGVVADPQSTSSAMTIYFSQPVASAGFVLEFSAPNFSGSDSHIARLFGVNESRSLSVHINAENKLRLSDGTGTSVGIWTSSAPLVAGEKYRIRLWGKAGATATTGEVKFSYSIVGSSTPVQTFSTTTASIPTGTPFYGYIWGRLSASTVRYKFDSPVWETDSTDLPEPITVAVAPPAAVLQPIVMFTAGGTRRTRLKMYSGSVWK
jgi:hypothetical protein